MSDPVKKIEELERALKTQKRITEAAIKTAAHWDDVSEELVWGDEARRYEEGPISERHMQSVICNYPQYEADIRSFVEYWNSEPRLTEEMLAAVEVKPDDVERSARRAMQIVNFYIKLRKVEAERDDLAARLREAEQRIAELEKDAAPDDILALNSALEREAVRKLVSEVSLLCQEGWDKTYAAAHATACEEISTRLETLWGERSDAALSQPSGERKRVSKEAPICEHGRNAWADDCGMCDLAGTDYAADPQPSGGEQETKGEG